MAEKITDITTVSTTELASILGITARRVQQLAQDGTIIPEKRGRYGLANSVQRYIEFLTSRDKGVQELDQAKLDAEVRLKEAKALIGELEAKELQGKMHRSEDVAAMTEDLIYFLRQMIITIPGRCSVDTAAAQTPAETSDIIRKEIYQIMTAMADYEYDPKKYEERVRERRAWDDSTEDGADNG